MNFARTAIRMAAIIAVTLCASGGPALGLILHPSDDPPTGLSTPADAVIGKWDNNASGVMITPNHIVTTNHQWGDVGTSVWIEEQEYTVAQIEYHSTADLRVARITNPDGTAAQLYDYVPLYLGGYKKNQIITIGGYGRGRGANVPSDPLNPTWPVHAYEWGGSSSGELRWGVNRIERTRDNVYGGQWTSDIVEADFDGPNVGGYIEHEATVAEWDSGGGWFVNDANQWYVAALTRTVDHASIRQAWFRSSSGTQADPDTLGAVRIEPYASWIIDVAMFETGMAVPGDADRDGDVDIFDFMILQANYGTTSGAVWADGDFEDDGDVDIFDFMVLQVNFAPRDGMGEGTVPEPTTIGLLGAGLLTLLRRRR